MPCNFRQVRVPCISNVMQFPWPGLSFGVLVDCGRPPVFLRYFAVRDSDVPRYRIHVFREDMIWVLPIDISEDVFSESYDHDSLSSRHVPVTPALNHFRSNFVLLTQ